MKEALKIVPVTSDDIIDLVLDENQIEKNNIPHNELFYLKFETKTLGPVWSENLNQFLDIHNHLIDSDVEVRSFDGTEWSNLFEHPRFSRRQPQVISEKQLTSNNNLYVLEHGIMAGPYSLGKIKKRINKNEILLTDMISADAGNSWEKIFKFDIFNRRENPGSPPPIIPDNIINQTEEYLSDQKNNVNLEISNLYFTRKNIQNKKNKSTSTSFLTSFKFILITISFIVLLISIIFISNYLSSPPLDNNYQKGQVTNLIISKKIKIINHQPKIKKTSPLAKNNQKIVIKNKRKTTFGKAIFKKEKISGEVQNSWVRALANKQNKYNIREENEYEDTPYEQDPIRNKLSRRTLDEDGYGENNSNDTVHDSRDVFLNRLQNAADDIDNVKDD